jgi:hypothetical protein
VKLLDDGAILIDFENKLAQTSLANIPAFLRVGVVLVGIVHITRTAKP